MAILADIKVIAIGAPAGETGMQPEQNLGYIQIIIMLKGMGY